MTPTMPAPRATVAQGARERPILFSGSMVRAILDGRKTQTRRVVVPPQGYDADGCTLASVGGDWWDWWSVIASPRRVRGRYGLPGDRLWVRETWWIVEREGHGSGSAFVIYEDEWEDGLPVESSPLRPYFDDMRYGKRPSIHMSRLYSRLLLEIVSVRVERLQEISFDDAVAEGITRLPGAQEEYRRLWDTINAKRGHSWASNPWVWVVEFKRVSP